MKKIIILYLLLFVCAWTGRGITPRFSTAGFYELPNSGRSVYNMNVAWRFYKGDLANASQAGFMDSTWQVVSLPDGIELLPEEASGNINYQGKVWYRKHFHAGMEWKGKKVMIHFEGIMGKSEIWINGKPVKKHYGGYLPVIADLTPWLQYGQENVIAVCADNSDDPSYPPGKPQRALDFSYFGGIYRDCWLITHGKLYITDPNYENEPGGGGLFVSYPQVGDKLAKISLSLHLRNEYAHKCKGSVLYTLKDGRGNVVTTGKKAYLVDPEQGMSLLSELTVRNPSLWSPESPSLYWLSVCVKDEKGTVVDGYEQRIGIRRIEMKGGDGLWLNGKPYPDKLIGGNRHQDFAVIGNALPNSLHWRDAWKLRNAGMRVIRAAHYPQDPAFLDACDELGLFYIEATPGWQFYNKDSIFVKRVYDNIRNMVRRDRNRPSLLFGEPVLNETGFPLDFALQAKKCVDEEMRFENAYSAIDPGSKGSESFPVIYTHPLSISPKKSSVSVDKADSSKVYFTREFGDNVDDWSANNSSSRVCRSWGEVPMLVQAEHYAAPPYSSYFTTIEALCRTRRNHLGGTLWHSFDHQRGCHPIAFYGGIMDAYRQPKTAYYMFMSQRPGMLNPSSPVESGPMVYVAHQMTPFSPADVTVYSNCEEVRLTAYEGGKQYTWKRSSSSLKMPSPIITFKNVFDFMDTKALSRAGKQKEVYLLAEGLIGGKVVATHKRVPSRKPVRVGLRIDNDGVPLLSDGSDIVVVIAEIVDRDGVVKRLNNFEDRFSVEGEGVLLEDESVGINPVRANWGSAPILLRTTTRPGKIKIKAEIFGNGVNAIEPGELEIESVQPSMKFIYKSSELMPVKHPVKGMPNAGRPESSDVQMLRKEISRLQKIISEKELKEVEMQQEKFGEKSN